jgi:hypothetical protein
LTESEFSSSVTLADNVSTSAARASAADANAAASFVFVSRVVVSAATWLLASKLNEARRVSVGGKASMQGIKASMQGIKERNELD